MENDFGTPAGKNLPAISQSLYGLRSEDFSFGVSPQKTPMQELKTPPVLMEKNQNVIISTKEESKSGSPPDMKVPLHKLFKFPGRYKSPTDRLISPVSECLRNRKMFYQPSILYSPPPKGVLWTPSKVIARLGKEINDPSSYCYWAYKIVFLDFGGIHGDVVHAFVLQLWLLDDIKLLLHYDIRAINGEAVHASPCKTGMIILGGGMPKHHICNANMMRNGADYAVFINTAQEFDGSDSGARPDEAVSWGKIRGSAIPVKVHCDATIAFPLLVAQTFAKKVKVTCNATTH